MKFLILAAIALSTASAFAGAKVFEAEAEYTKPGWDARWNNLEQLGVERTAEKRAYAACVKSGATDCVILEGATITACGYMTGGGNASGCKAGAYARGNQ